MVWEAACSDSSRLQLRQYWFDCVQDVFMGYIVTKPEGEASPEGRDAHSFDTTYR